MCHLAWPGSEHLGSNLCCEDKAPHARAVTILRWPHKAIEDAILSVPRNTLDLTQDDGAHGDGRRQPASTQAPEHLSRLHYFVRCAVMQLSVRVASGWG